MDEHANFFGQIGINPTAITLAIEEENFSLAEDLIRETQGEYLDDGQYGNVPLRLVLSNDKNITHIRNLYLAKLLVERGANPNISIPHTDMDRVFSTPFQDLVVYYESLRTFINGKQSFNGEHLQFIFYEEEFQLRFLTYAFDLDNIKCQPNIEDCSKLLAQSKLLIDIFLTKGADPNVKTNFSSKTLFHWVIGKDPKLAKELLQTGRVNCDTTDAHGNSPLMDAILRNSPEDSFELYLLMCEFSPSLDTNYINCHKENSFSLAVFAGAPSLAFHLFRDGAEICHVGSFRNLPIGKCCDVTGTLSQDILELKFDIPILYPFYKDSPVQSLYTAVRKNFYEYSPMTIESPDKSLIDKVIVSSISPIIDCLYLNMTMTADALFSLLKLTNFLHLVDNFSSDAILPLMFGHSSAGLQQLCIRILFDHIFNLQYGKITGDFTTDVVCIRTCKNSFNKNKIDEIIPLLGLPQKLSCFFEIEAAKYQICHLAMGFSRGECSGCSNSSDSIIEDDGTETFESSEEEISDSDYEESHPLSSDMMSEYSSSASSEGLQLSDNDLSEANAIEDSENEDNSAKKLFDYFSMSSDSEGMVEFDGIVPTPPEFVDEQPFEDFYEDTMSYSP